MASFDDSLETITVRDSAGAVTFVDIQSAASIALNNVSAAVIIDFDDDVLDSDDATVSVSVDEFTSTLTLNVGGDDAITTLDLTVVDDSTVALAQTGTVDTIEAITISGSGDLTITESLTAFDSITEVDASGLAGGLTMDLSNAAAAVTFTGGSGDDDVTSSGDDDEISTGAGDDTITMVGTVDLTIDAGAGDDTVEMTELTADDDIDGGAGTNTASLDADDLDDLETLTTAGSITNFSVAALTGALAADLTFDANGTGIDTVDVTVDIGAIYGLTLDNFSGGTVIIGAAQADEVAVLSVGTSDTITVEFDAGAAITVVQLTLTDVESVSIVADTDENVTLTAIDLSGTTSLTLSGAGAVTITTPTADSLETVDISDFTGTITGLDLESSDGVEVIIGNLAADATITLNDTDTADDTITFADADLDVAITIVDFNAGLGNDKIDLSVFGITSLSDADLDISDDGFDTTIAFDGIDGTIILDSVVTTELDASNFIFA
jgi:hypothetical protein